MQELAYDVIIVGGGPSGLTAGLYASRSRLKTLLLEKMGCGGQSVITDFIENYPGFPDGINGYELAAKFEEQAKKFGLETKMEEVTSIARAGSEGFIVTTAEAQYSAGAVIAAVGARFKQLGVPGEELLRGKGVSYCATCDGPFFRDKEVVVAGGGDSAVQEALYLTRFAKKVTIVHRRGTLRATKILQDRAFANPKIAIVWNAKVAAIEGKEKVEQIRLLNTKDGSESTLKTDGVFIFIGWEPNTGFLGEQVRHDDRGYVITDDAMRTSMKGVFACGDARKKILRQVVTAVGEGAVAAVAAQEYLDDLRGTSYK
jgi:thioredoxin reductase (NADPH)